MIRIRQIKIHVNDNKDKLKSLIIKRLRINEKDLIKVDIFKESLDARDKNNIYYVYEVNVLVNNEDEILKRVHDKDIFKSPSLKYEFKKSGNVPLESRPVIVGSGPAGLFSAYILALSGYKPLIIERGEEVTKRCDTVKRFWETNELNTESNVQFGEGGAGTFSDGKLNTLVKDENNRMRFVFETFVKFGAKKDILYSYKPHIGTDILVDVVRNMREEIIKLGGTFLFNTKLSDIIFDDKITEIVINNNEKIRTNVLVLAIGHSARDTFRMLYEKNIKMISKPFAVGIRVIHKQDVINKSQYGNFSKLYPAPYKLTYKSSTNRGVYSFCMCPGGYVVNASSMNGMLAINGMSYSKRDSGNANSAIVVTIDESDYGSCVLDGIIYQERLESAAYNLCNGNIVVQNLGDYKNNRVSDKLSFEPMIKGSYSFGNINKLFNDHINNSIKEAFIDFGKKIKGFNDDDVILAALEARTSSPIRIVRDSNFESSIKGVYPCGEGAGYAGGITSAAMDGIRVAEAIIEKYKVG